YQIAASTVNGSSTSLDNASYRFSREPTANAGAPESTVIGNLPRWTQLWIGLRARDQFIDWSPRSNVIQGQTGVGPTAVGSAALAFERNPTSPPVRLRWSPGPRASSADLAIHDVSGRRVRHYALTPRSPGLLVWDGATDDGRRLPAGLYFATLTTPDARIV